MCSTQGMSLFPPTVPDLRFLSVPTRRGTTRRRSHPAHATREQSRVARLFRQHASEMKPYLCRRGVAGEDADDVLQRVFIVLVRRIGEIVPGCERAFLYRAAAHEAFHLQRSFARRLDHPGELEASTTQSVLPDELLGSKTAREHLHRALAELPTSLREIFELVELEELSLTQAAARLAVPLGTAKTRLRRARATLGQAMANRGAAA